MAFLGIAVSCPLPIPFLVFILRSSLCAFLFPFANADAALEVASLLAFKSAVTQDPLSVLEDWRQKTTANVCNWTGVTCSPTNRGRVAQIDLSNKRLGGHIAPHIGNLSYLQVLNLSSNVFSGDIPSSLGRLRRLHTLHLRGNSLSGAIPTRLGNLSSLRLLSLSDNNLKGGIPSSFGHLSNLELLGLYNNSFLGGPIPASLGGLKKLKEFLSFNNGHTGPIPLALCDCSVLVKLELRGNKLRGIIPHCLGSLSRLQWLALQRNSLHGEIPESIWNLTDLQILSFGHNNLRGTLPAALGKLLRIQTVDLSFNHFVGRIPEHLANCTEVSHLQLMGNQLSGALPVWLGRLSKLQDLSLYTNMFTGTIPDSLKNCSKLQILQLDENELEGTIPSSIGQLSQLSVLRLYSNYFVSGLTNSMEPIPALKMLYNCSYLTELQLDYNFLHGTLPSDMGMHWPRISSMSLGHCNIFGNIPESLGNFSSLLAMYLQGNLFSGQIPGSIGKMKRMQALNLSDNRLNGSLPWQITLLNGSLSYVCIANNKLSGLLPSFIGNLVKLQELDLRNNSFSSRIPPQLGNCKDLLALNLCSNKFLGTIPPEVADLKHIQKFELSENSLTGDVPAAIEGLIMAEYIDLSHNKLRGNIGLRMDQWLNAQYINLSFNNFSGELPESIAKNLTQLQFMDLSRNNFTGSISELFFNLSDLNYLDVSYNNFQGRIACSVAFSNHSKFFLTHNLQLCGDCFTLPKCKIHKRHHRLLFGVCISLAGALILSFCLVLLILKRKVSTSSTTETKRQHLWLSSEQIRVATQNFSPANVIGQGRHGRVYKGTLQGGIDVAIKVFPTLGSSTTSDSTTFTRECETLGKVRHRNLMRIITVCSCAQFKALILPLMPNSLHKVLYEANSDAKLSSIAFNLQIRLHILQDLAAALTYLHHDCSPCIVHCDIKPQNILLDEEMTVHLSDFGIARFLCQRVGPTTSSTAAAVGSPGYIAPEYGITGRVSTKGDVYSFGIVVLEVLTGLMPTHPMFDGDLTLPKWISVEILQDSEKEETRKRLNRKGKRGIQIAIEKEEDWIAVEALIRIGMMCCCERADERPNMRDVQRMLYSISTNGNGNENVNEEEEEEEEDDDKEAEHGILSRERTKHEGLEIKA